MSEIVIDLLTIKNCSLVKDLYVYIIVNVFKLSIKYFLCDV